MSSNREPASHPADAMESGAVEVMEKDKALPMKARANNASRGASFHLARLPSYLFAGCWGECIAQQGQPMHVYGTLVVIIEYTLFVLLSLSGAFKAPRNISICGYMELLPDWVAILYFLVAASGIDSTLWHAAIIAKKEPFMPLAVVQMVLSVLSAITLAGFSVFPRCLWTRHQTCVVWWVYFTSAAMAVMFLRDFRKPTYTIVPALCWAIGTYWCAVFYRESSMNFYTGEAISIVSYVMWCSSLQRQHGRKFTLLNVLVYDGAAAVAMLLAFRYHQWHVCKVTGKW